MPRDIQWNQEAFMALVNNPSGGLARKLNSVADELVAETKDLLSVTASQADLRLRNPSDYPRERSGKLKEAIVIRDPKIEDGVIEVGIGFDFSVAPHARVLLGLDPPGRGHEQRTWQFAPERLPRRET